MLCNALYRTCEYINEFTYILVLFDVISLTYIQIKVLQGQPCILSRWKVEKIKMS